MKIIHLAAAFLLTAALVGGLPGAEKSAPKPINQDKKEGPDIEGFNTTYTSRGEPKILIICGTENTNTRRQQGPAAVGQAQKEAGIGKALEIFDPAGDAASFKSAIEEILLETDIRLVNLDALAEKDRREVDLMKQRNLDEAVKLLGTKVNADIALVIHMLASPAVEARGAKYRVNVETLSVTTGEKIGGFPFDWQGELDNAEIKGYAQDVTAKWMKQFVSRYARQNQKATRYQLRLLGIVGAQQLRQVRDGIKKIAGVKQVLAGDAESNGKESISTMEVRYEGDRLDLTADLQAMGQAMNMMVTALDFSSGAITLGMTPPRPIRLTPGQAYVDEASPAHAKKLADFQAAYRGKGSPRIGIMVNRELTDEEKKDPAVQEELAKLKAAAGATPSTTSPAAAPAAPVGTMVTINLASGGGIVASGHDGAAKRGGDAAHDGADKDKDKKNPEDMLNTRLVEDYLFKQLRKLGLDLVDTDIAKHELVKQGERERKIFNDQELVFLLGQAANVDVVIEGVGRNQGDNVGYTFRAVRVGGGNVLATEGGVINTDFSDRGAQGRQLEDYVKFIAGSLAEQLNDSWSPPNKLTVHLYNCKTMRELSVVSTMFKDNIPGVSNVAIVSHEAGKEGGIGVFTVEYSSSFDELVKAIGESSSKMPFDFDGSTASRDELTIKKRDGI